MKRYLDAAANALLKFLLATFSAFPYRAINRLRFFGTLFYRLLPLRKATLAENIRLAGIANDDASVEKIIRGVYECQILNFFEFLWMSNLVSTEAVHANFRFHGLERLRRAILEGEGGVIASSHLGNWELLAAVLGKLGVRMGILVAERDIEIHRTVRRAREITGNEVIDRNHAAIKCFRMIKKKRIAGIVSDQHTDNAGVETTFFGRPCKTTSLPAALSLKSGCPIYCIYMKRAADGSQDVYIEEPIYARDFAKVGSGDEGAIAATTQAINDSIEKYIRMAPEQWFWFHKRWR